MKTRWRRKAAEQTIGHLCAQLLGMAFVIIAFIWIGFHDVIADARIRAVVVREGRGVQAQHASSVTPEHRDRDREYYDLGEAIIAAHPRTLPPLLLLLAGALIMSMPKKKSERFQQSRPV